MVKIDKERLLKLGRWRKCARPECPNPASRNIEGSCCSHRCNFLLEKTRKSVSEGFKRRLERDSSFQRRDEKAREKLRQHGKERIKRHRTKFYRALTEKLGQLSVRQRGAENRTYRAFLDSASLRYEAEKGKFEGETSIPARDEFSKRVYQMLDDNPVLTEWRFGSIHVPYLKGEEKHRHSFAIVDVEASYADGSKKAIDIREHGMSIDDLEKFGAVQKWCSENGYKYEVWTKEMLDYVFFS